MKLMKKMKGIRLVAVLCVCAMLMTFAPVLAASKTFTDVDMNRWYGEYIQYVSDNGIMSGYSDGTNRFGVNDFLTRGQFATMIHRMAGTPEVQFSGKFTDVPAGKFYSNAVEWCAANGIITGYKNNATNQPTGVFGTGDFITRQDLAVILYRYEGDYLKNDVSGQASFDKFTDGAKVSTYANGAMKWCVSKGIISGKNGVELDPKGNATRAEVAAMVTRFMKTSSSDKPGPAPETLSFTSVGGACETIYATISGVSDGDVKAVSYSGAMSGSLNGDDLKYLVRDSKGGVRIDIPGLKAGNYTLEVTTNAASYKKEGIVVENYDRSGYAHYKYTDGVGAYNDDGTLKEKAIVLYVTEENKNDVTVTCGSTTVKGIGNILNTCGKSGSGKHNTNQDILQKLNEADIPLVVRIVGKVSNIVDITDPSSKQTIEGLTAYGSVDFGGNAKDNGSMARMSDGRNITIEGIGTDANIDGWGLHFIANLESEKYGKSFEVRNISFTNVPEDAVGMEGVQKDGKLTASVERCWIHNNRFSTAKFIKCADPEGDKKEGDGSLDFKRGQYLTVSYNYVEAAHKTHLVGASDDNIQYHLTYHHNIWYMCAARGPLTRQANVHMYNNAIIGQTDYMMQTRANAYIFSESNFFYACKSPQEVKSGGGPIKSYNDSLVSCINSMNATVVTDKTKPVTSNNKYSAFDTNPEISYIPSGNYELQEDLTELRKVLYAKTGTMKENPIKPSDVTMSMISMIPSDVTPVNVSSLPYTTLPGSKGKLSKKPFVFTVGGPVDVEVKYTSEAVTGTGVLVNEAGVKILQGSGTARNLPAGTYMIVPSNIQPGTQSPLKEWTYKECTLTTLKITSNDPSAHYHNYTSDITKPATCKEEGVKTYTCTEKTGECNKKTYTETIDKLTTHTYGEWVIDKEATETEAGSKHRVCTVCEKTETVAIPVGGGASTGGSAVHDFTESGLESSFYTISGNLSTSKGTVEYAGKTLTQCLKLESATNISFTAAKPGKLTLVFVTPGNIKIDGAKKTFDSNVFTIDLAAGEHKITKADTMNLFYMSFEEE